MKEYIIEYTKENRSALQEMLAGYSPHYFKNALYCAVKVTPEQEPSLLEMLADVPGITYREATTRQAFRK